MLLLPKLANIDVTFLVEYKFVSVMKMRIIYIKGIQGFWLGHLIIIYYENIKVEVFYGVFLSFFNDVKG